MGRRRRAAARSAPSRRPASARRVLILRYIRQRNAERDLDPAGDETVLFGYVVELFGSRRHRRLPPSWRNATCTCAILHFQRCLSARDADPTDPVLLARKVRKAKAGVKENRTSHWAAVAPWPADVCTGGDGCTHHPPCRRALADASAEPVRSRGREGWGAPATERSTSPAAELRPARCQPTAGALDGRTTAQRRELEGRCAQVAFYSEVVALLTCTLAQYVQLAERQE